MKSDSDQRKKGSVQLENVKHKILVLSGKGGVGKSTVAANLAVSLGINESNKVGLMDADLHGPNIPKILGIEDRFLSGGKEEMEPVSLGNLRVTSIQFALPDENSPVVWRGPMKMKAIRQFLEDVNWGHLEHLIVDLPPGTGDEPLSVAQLIEDIDGAVIVTTPQQLALLDVRKAVQFTRDLDIPVAGLVENMSDFICPKCGERTDLFGSGGGKKAAEELGIPFLGAIPLDGDIVKSGDRGRPFVKEFEESRAAKAFMKVSDRILQFVSGNRKGE